MRKIISKAKILTKDTLLNSLCSSYFMPIIIRRLILNILGHNIEGRIMAGAFLGYGGGKLIVGRNSSCNYRCFFDLGDNIVIGDNCQIAFQVTFVNSFHKVGDSTKRAGTSIAKPIVVGDGCWIGANVTILPGVTIGKGCIIGAGSVITKDCSPNSIYLGVPAKRVKELPL